ncbi:MAG TPA: TetR/AcrR family transcriptional regulator [Acidimicrobiales bacterium]|nr:TetR/AcrR family transcriptional regulator [Acidimicrobiales bacterium]
MARDKRRETRHAHYEELEQQISEHVRDLVVDKLAKKAAKRDRRTAKGRIQADAIDLLSDRLSQLDLWTRVPPGERRTRVTRDELAAAAVRIADTEGLSALSMRRLATEVGVGTMTLYHYVRNKDELLSLVVDAIMGEVAFSESEKLPRTWRPALEAIAIRTREVMTRHPWMFDIADDPPIGPNAVRHFDQTLEALSSLPLALAEKLDVASAVDEFVFGFCVHERNNARTGQHVESKMIDYVETLLETDAYPTLSALADDLGLDRMWDEVQRAVNAPKRFEKHLDLLLDGIEADIARRRH